MFTSFKKSLSDRLDFLTKESTHLYQVDIDKDELWDLYLDSFPAGTNEIFRERREYDCSCCRGFIKNYGGIVGIINNKKVTIWSLDGLEPKYQVVADALNEKISSLPVSNVFVSKFSKLGTDKNQEMLEDGEVVTWHHFYYKLPNQYVLSSRDSVESHLGSVRQTKEVIERSFKELTMNALDTVIELIDNKTLYRGEEYSAIVTKFRTSKRVYDGLGSDEERNNYCWEQATNSGRSLAIRNSAIGTLLTNLSEDMDVELAVRKYEQVVAPANYKRPKAIFTKAMVEKAKAKLVELGLENSLSRRYAKLEDISIQNVLWASGESKKVMKDPFDELMDSAVASPKNYKRADEVSVEDFVENVLPTASSIEVLLENRFSNNLMSLIAPGDLEAPSLFKWGNGFSWSYNGEFTDSIKEAVKIRGGKVDGVLRCSLSWAEGSSMDNSDLDLHCITPNKKEIYFGDLKDRITGGNLDVDITDPKARGFKNIVENITWPNKRNMTVGDYRFFVRNFSLRGSQQGFRAEIEFNGETFNFEYDKPLRNKEDVEVAIVHFDGENFTIKKSLPDTKRSREIWGVSTMKFVPVSTFMYSPNYWDGKGVGNRHYFFMLENCVNDGTPRGFFNEFLKSDLEPHRKVFEALGDKMRVEHTSNQLSGLGLSSTIKNTVTVKVDGKVMNININTKTDKNGKLISESSEKKVSL
jgi:hypothetical protein